jgi:chromosome segregation ATPase
MFSGQWPEPQVGPNRIEGGKLIPVTEAERRELFLNAIEDSHPLMDLIQRCINNDPQLRPHAGETIMRISEVSSQFPASFANRLEMLRQLERDRREETEEGERKEDQISSLKEVTVEKEQTAIEMEILKLSHSTEVKQLQLQLRDMITQNQYTKAENEAKIVELKSKYSALETQIENKTKILLKEREQSARQLREEREQFEIQLAHLRSDLSRSKSENTTLQSDITDKDTAIQMKEAIVKRKDSELEAKSRALGEKDATISAMSEQITKARDFLATTKLQVSTYLKGTIICRVTFL